MWIRDRSTPVAGQPRWVSGLVLGPVLVLAALIPVVAGAVTLDFGAALQDLETGEEVETVTASEGGTMEVRCTNDGFGPNVCIIFDSEEPSDVDLDLGTPNVDFGGLGVGDGGESGQEGANEDVLGNLLIIAENVDDDDGDGFVDVPDDESDGGTVWLKFSHAGHLSLTIVDVDEEEEAPSLKLYRDGECVAEVEGESLGDNSVQHLDLSEYGSVDAVCIELDGSSAIADVQLDVEVVGTEANTWSNVKAMFR